MPGPTTEVLSDDIKDLREDLKILRGEVHEVDKRILKQTTEINLFKWAVGACIVAVLSHLGAGIWWAATLTADSRALAAKVEERFAVNESKFAERFKAADALAEQRFKAIEIRADDRQKAIEARADDRQKAIDGHFKAVDERFKAIDARFDRLEAMIARALAKP